MSDPSTPIEIGAFVEQSKQNAESIKGLRSEFTEGFNEVRKAIDRMGERIHVATRPNFSTMAALAGVVITIIVAISTPIGFFVWDKITDQGKKTVDLDEKLQREFNLSIATATQKAEAINVASRERHEEANRDADLIRSEIKTIRDWQNTLVVAELQELRERRMRDGQPSTNK